MTTKPERAAKLAAGTCTHPTCERRAMRGWTVCPRHGTGGRRLFKGERAAARAHCQKKTVDTPPFPC